MAGTGASSMQWSSLVMFFPESHTSYTLPWPLLSSPGLLTRELCSRRCELETEAERWQHVPLMTSGAGRVIWLFSQHQNLPRKGAKLLFFTHFVSHLSDWHPSCFVCLASWRFQLLVEILSCNATLNVLSSRLLLQSLGYEGRDLTRGIQPLGGHEVLHHKSFSSAFLLGLHPPLISPAVAQFEREVKLQSSLPRLKQPHPLHTQTMASLICLLIMCTLLGVA